MLTFPKRPRRDQTIAAKWGKGRKRRNATAGRSPAKVRRPLPSSVVPAVAASPERGVEECPGKTLPVESLVWISSQHGVF